ncbi:hypothetical protein GWI33_022709 [Rhynchophorus ferrugineus]|uniref:Uncharacterized protein n=1 Tax=Rhynchophorus ferrugineus TaxID=354439 RepID=A0A834HLZ5_RHYFE|nr:hypothetical protein GWI33_022712 [Rhynchophorus ferrugineus]KAF7264662.1 hypothetical protein GWI33_022709 [Rhynchophorus ferrugineus]
MRKKPAPRQRRTRPPWVGFVINKQGWQGKKKVSVEANHDLNVSKNEAIPTGNGSAVRFSRQVGRLEEEGKAFTTGTSCQQKKPGDRRDVCNSVGADCSRRK